MEKKQPQEQKQEQEHNKHIEEYINQLTPFEQSAHRIARNKKEFYK
jgi:hypothetical protein